MSNGGKRSSTSTTFHLIAGLGSGFTSAILLQPADLLKTRLQQPGSISLLSTIKDIASKPNPIRQLWRGTLPSTIRTSLGSALYFTSLNAFRTNLARSTRFTSIRPNNSSLSPIKPGSSSSSLPSLSPLGNLLSGSIARATVGFVMMPFTVLKVRYESNLYAYNSLYGAAKDISVREGLRGFFAGFGATALRDAPYAGLYVVFYEGGKRYLSGLVDAGATGGRAGVRASTNTSKSMGGDAPMQAGDIQTAFPATTAGPARMTATTSAVINFASSTLAASTATAITNPPDAIKTRLQLQPQKYRNTVQAARLMLKEEGVRSLFDGLALRMARKAMSSALAWTVYEEVIRRAERRWDTVD